MQSQYRTMADVRAANAQAAPRFFHDAQPWAVCANGAGVEQLYGGRFFITVEYSDLGTPRYQVREALPTGQVVTVRRFDWYTTRAQARDLIRELLAAHHTTHKQQAGRWNRPACQHKEKPMLTISQTRGLASRLERAQAIADADAVHSIAGQGTFVVRNGDGRNGDGTQFYLVCTEPDRESCTCPDYQHHGLPLGLPCKHILAAQIVAAEPKGE